MIGPGCSREQESPSRTALCGTYSRFNRGRSMGCEYRRRSWPEDVTNSWEPATPQRRARSHFLIAWPEGNDSFVDYSKKPECLVRLKRYFRDLGFAAGTKTVDQQLGSQGDI